MAAVAELAVSNICWPDGPETQVAAIDTLARSGVYAIDIAPGKAFPEMGTVGPDGIDRDELVNFRRTLRVEADASPGVMRVAGFQAVTFGRSESIFSEDIEQARALADHMRGIIRLAEFVGAQTIVYGSGGTRLTEGLTEEQINERAAAFFVPLSEEAHNSGVVLGIEPVSTTWTKGQPVFGRTGAEVVDFASLLHREHGSRSLQFVPDSFAMHDAGDDIQNVLLAAKERGVLAPHAQIAEPGMAPHEIESPIDRSHDQLDIALMRSLAPQAAERAQIHGVPPTLAIEMFAPKNQDGKPVPVDDVRFVLASVISAAKTNYSRSLRVR